MVSKGPGSPTFTPTTNLGHARPPPSACTHPTTNSGETERVAATGERTSSSVVTATSPPSSEPVPAVDTMIALSLTAAHKKHAAGEREVQQDALKDFCEADRIAARTVNVNGVEIVRPTLREASAAAAAEAAKPPKMMWDDAEPTRYPETLMSALRRHRELHDEGNKLKTSDSIHIQLDNKRISANLLNRFEDWEIKAMQVEAIADYHLRRNRAEIADVCRQERLAREDLEDDCLQRLAMVHGIEHTGWQDAHKSSTLLSLLERRLVERKQKEEFLLAQTEERLREEGRAAWRREQAELASQAAESERLATQRRTMECQGRAALVFLASRERVFRDEVTQAEEAAWGDMCRAEPAARVDLERLAYEQFMNSPEQLALAAAKLAKEAKERKKAARIKQLFEAEQMRLISICHHGRNGVSLLDPSTAPAAKRVCPRCRVRYDEALGYLVREDSGAPGPVATRRCRSSSQAPGARVSKAKVAVTAQCPLEVKDVSTVQGKHVASTKSIIPLTLPSVGPRSKPGDTAFSSPIFRKASARLPSLTF